MHALITIPIDLFRVLENHCGANSWEFKLLRNAVIEGDSVIMRCEESAAARLREWAKALCPEAAEKIAIAPDPTPPERP